MKGHFALAADMTLDKLKGIGVVPRHPFRIARDALDEVPRQAPTEDRETHSDMDRFFATHRPLRAAGSFAERRAS